MLLLVKLYYTVHNYNLKCFAKCAVLGKILRVTHVHQQSPENLRGFFLLLIRLLYNNAYDDANSVKLTHFIGVVGTVLLERTPTQRIS